MAKKSKTQKAKASAARQAKKAQALEVNENTDSTAAQDSAAKRDKAAPKQAKKAEKPKKTRFKFLRDVKAELKRVTWPTKQEVLRWTGVVIAALLFFGIFVAVLDNIIVTPLIVFISGIGA